MFHSVSAYIQIAGSLVVLVPFVLVQLKRLTPESRSYIWFNVVGSVILAVDAWHGEQWGFMLLEGTWAAVSLWSLTRRRDRHAADGRLERAAGDGREGTRKAA